MGYINDPTPDNTTYFYKSYIDLSLIDKIEVSLSIDLLFS